MNRRPDGKWSKSFDACQGCGGTSIEHSGRGLCIACYSAMYAAENKERVDQQKAEWYRRYKAQGGLGLMKKRRELDHYDGLREEILKRDNYQCVRCMAGVALAVLTVHHKDGRGRNKPKGEKNNDPSNLETLCRACHMSEHRAEIRKIYKEKNNGFWSWRWKLKECVECERSDRKHMRDGYCVTCWARIKKQRIRDGTFVKANRKGKYVKAP